MVNFLIYKLKANILIGLFYSEIVSLLHNKIPRDNSTVVFSLYIRYYQVY